eukprot:augustus_masked-scaffold_4-processed-gene-18.12-mRNA-1 protein AED:1.00 eAED:1.00 QI:0/-1/0/0/-1/1/1/0/538
MLTKKIITLSALALNAVYAQQTIEQDVGPDRVVNVEATAEDTLVLTFAGGFLDFFRFEVENAAATCAELNVGGVLLADVATEIETNVGDETISFAVSDLIDESEVEDFFVFFVSDAAEACVDGTFVTISLQSSSPTPSPTFEPTFSPTFSPSFSPSFAPTDQPTNVPTGAPVESIETLIPWDIPADLARFSQDVKLTTNEVVVFSVLSAHNLVELASAEAFQACSFEEEDVVEVLVDNEVADEVIVFDTPGTVRYFACNKTNAAGQTHCDILGQKMRVEVISRGDELQINWNEPLNDQEVELFAEPFEILEEQTIRFSVDAGQDVRQFLTLADFQECNFFNEGQDFFENGNPSFPVVSEAADDEDVLYRDFLQGLNSDQQDILWFGSSRPGACGEDVTACECGLKKAVRVVAELGVNDDDNDDDDGDEGDNGIILIAVVAVGAAFIGFMVFAGLRKRNAQPPTLENKMVQNQQAFMSQQNQNQMPYNQQSNVDSEVVKSPYSSYSSVKSGAPPGLQGPRDQGVSSLAKSKAKSVQLDF